MRLLYILTLFWRNGSCLLFFFFNDTATTEIYTLSLHDALPISPGSLVHLKHLEDDDDENGAKPPAEARSEEHTSELQSPDHIVCRLLLEKKTTTKRNRPKPVKATQDFSREHVPVRTNSQTDSFA